MNISSNKKIYPEPSSCSKSCFPSGQNDTNIKYLLHVCYMEWVIMGILTVMTMVKMTDLEQEEWVWLKIFSGMLFFFSIPFAVGLHEHADCEDHHPTKDIDDKDDFKSDEDSEPEEQSKKIEPSSKKKKPQFSLLKKPAKKTMKATSGKGEKSEEDESADADSLSGSTSSSTKVTGQKKRSKGLNNKTRTVRRTSKKTSSKVSRSSSTSSSTSPSSTSSQSEGSHHVKAEVIIKKESATATGSDEDNKMEVDVQAKVEEDKMDVPSKAEGEPKVTTEIAHGSNADKDSVKLDHDMDDMEVDTKKSKK